MRSPIVRGIVLILLIAFVAVTLQRRRGSGVALGPGAGWAADLEDDRCFERSLISREIVVILLIALLVLVRQLLS